MEITIFAKKRTSKDGKTFYNYLTTLKHKDGREIVTQVKFRDECGNPKPEKCPMNIVVEKNKVNFSSRQIVKEETGELITSNVLWVSEWKPGTPFIDHSMDDFV